MTYLIVLVLWMSSSGFASSTIKSASLPGSSEPRYCSSPIAGANDGGRRRGDPREDVLVVAEPGPALRPLIDFLVREEALDLRHVVNVVVLVEIVLGPGSAVVHEQRRRIRDARLRDELDVIVVERCDRIAMLGAGI